MAMLQSSFVLLTQIHSKNYACFLLSMTAMTAMTVVLRAHYRHGSRQRSVTLQKGAPKCAPTAEYQL
jgi:hypothetical protein